MDRIVFYILAAVTVLASLGVISSKNPMHSVMLLIVSFGALAGLYVLLDAPFTAVTQIIVYAGAIMVVFLFVVMLLNVPREEPHPPGLASGAMGRRFGVLLALVLVGELVWALARLGPRGMTADAEAVAAVQSVRAVGRALYTTHAFAFEATSVLILVAMVGAVVLARREPRD